MPLREGIEAPVVVWLPSIAPSGMVFYSGEKICGVEEGNVFIGGMRRSEEIPGTK